MYKKKLYSLSIARLPGEIQPERCSIKVWNILKIIKNKDFFLLVSTCWLLDYINKIRANALDE